MVIVRKGMAAEFLREIVNPFELPAEESGPQRKVGNRKDKAGRRCLGASSTIAADIFTVIARRLMRMNPQQRTARSRQRTSVRSIEELDELLSEPTEAAIDTLGALDGDIVILGVGGKMGPTLARMAKRASEIAGVSRRVIGVSRFSSPGWNRSCKLKA